MGATVCPIAKYYNYGFKISPLPMMNDGLMQNQNKPYETKISKDMCNIDIFIKTY